MRRESQLWTDIAAGEYRIGLRDDILRSNALAELTLTVDPDRRPAHEVDAGLLLGVNDDAGGVDLRLLRAARLLRTSRTISIQLVTYSVRNGAQPPGCA
jgi:hypothetical protein